MRSRSMQALTDDTRRRHPGVVIYGVGDDDHKLRYSDHNEDDTPGSLAPQSDADNVPEHRAIDIMLGPNFTKAQAYAYIADLLADPAALARLKYIIFDGWIWSRSNGWKKVAFTGDPHTDHIHISGDAADDENAAGWPAVYGGDMSLSDADKAFLRAAPWQYNGRGIGENNGTTVQKSTLAYFDEMLLTVRAIAGKVDIDPAELAAIQAAAEAGAKEALAESADAFVAAIVDGVTAELDPDNLSMDAVQAAAERAVRNVLGGLDGATPSAGS